MIQDLIGKILQNFYKQAFRPQFSVKDAIDEICEIYNAGQLLDSDNCFTVKWMKTLKL